MASLIVGLGNPGGEYARTRHNVGWMCLTELESRGRFGRERREGPAKVREGQVGGYDIVTARPQTFMNVSGRAAVHLLATYGVPAQDLIVVHDDVDLPLGRLRLKRGGGAAGNKGVLSIVDSLRTPDFLRVRIGVSRPVERDQMIDYVLDRFTPEERDRLAAVLPRTAAAVMALVRDGLEPAMSEYNRAPDD
ncbi:MAG: aminoacyl-tRNA hydrolase [Candidatus Dormibacteraeota bacterium]|uniref:Peptidyl-tRNA hydrolase n=1 Tax=Candidatus Aeolococcus gillhamiae TaxID=3127015 RepID=A0A2W6AKR5_9BACT|nr:aminoacyl-tRNA hydrolase [Candidatus Dormibacteraeota bacterium]PZR78311.1 MAG: aminoacyl-tRNA hydrolase [Candidatus Dormibacter sp. RRmetagenome_bin12]